MTVRDRTFSSPFSRLGAAVACLLIIASFLAAAGDSVQAQPSGPETVGQVKPAPAEAKPQNGTEAPRGRQAIPVGIEHTGDDPIGLKLAFTLKERFAASPLFRLASGDEKRVTLRIATRAEFPGRPGLATVHAVSWVYAENPETLSYFLSQHVGAVEAAGVADEAEALIARTDSLVGRYKYLLE